ncbi:MAG: MtnX-like HAD-IB family phosphatase [Pelotomaculum sp.]|uniref:Uncharacterized conserved protein n=1 Tax=Pelotomaculum thermopropionicum (strain DSM 13744 / JCM 10971 / SI) TaxID=370438 RepID=A5D3T4_PELTS|nr:MtnX-like HAD-IB family phosphatase [Pelotomaculum sp.]BAF59107.1 uncharacterized conserved protein [Pelotomaculum thermopropionicum SI]
MEKVFFVDFDGTVTKKDTCVAMIEAFAGGNWREINEAWERKEISTEECANMIFRLFRAGIEDIRKLLDGIEIDGHFKDFLSFCRERGYKIYILSDGYDFCIETVFKKHGIELPYYANKMVYGNGFKIECFRPNPACGICGTCKTKLIEELKGDGSQVIYIGDGYSDTCPAMKADVVFAKGVLYRHCRENGKKAIYYNNFGDIINYFFQIKKSL